MIIANDTELRSYLKSVTPTVTGEETLYAKLTPAMEQIEAWLTREITGGITLTDDLTAKIKPVIAFAAYHKAIPQLDLILTSNGFGIVSNQNVAPASRERVDALRSMLLNMRDSAMDALMTALYSTTAYQSTAAFKRFTLSVINTPGMMEHTVYTPSHGRWEEFSEKLPEIYDIERCIIDRGLSQELHTLCCTYGATGSVSSLSEYIPTLHYKVVSMVKEALRNSEYLHSPHFSTAMRHIVHFITSNAALDAVWKTTDVGKAWNVTPFANDKDSGGYWL